MRVALTEVAIKTAGACSDGCLNAIIERFLVQGLADASCHYMLLLNSNPVYVSVFQSDFLKAQGTVLTELSSS